MTEPPRWVDDVEVPPEIRADLQAMSEHSIPFDVAAEAARFEQATASPAIGQAIGRGLPWIGAVALVAAIGAGGWYLSHSNELEDENVVEQVPPPEAPRPEAAEALPPEPSQTHPAELEPIEPSEEDVVEPTASEPDVSRSGRVRSTPANAPASAPANPPSVQDEIAHMARLRSVADRDPRAALALAREGARRFPDGLFAEEREAISILALDALNRPARRRARRFLRVHPESSFATRIRGVADR